MNDVSPPAKTLQNLDLPLDLLLLDGPENLDDAFLILEHVDTLKHFRVFTATNLTDYFVVILFAVYVKRNDKEKVKMEGEGRLDIEKKNTVQTLLAASRKYRSVGVEE